MRFLLAAAITCLSIYGSSLIAAESANAIRPPNIVFILADDLGWTDVGCFGTKYYETPNIDRLAQQGMKFTSAYTCGPNCAPTRASLMSGQYTPRHGILTVNTLERGQDQYRKMIPPPNETKLPLDKKTIAQVLKSAGYATAMFGKWHLGNDAAHHPAQRGFDSALVSMGRHFDFQTIPPVKSSPETCLADFLTDQAVKFIDDNKSKPFFLYLPHFAVHAPHHAKKELIARFERKEPVGGHRDPTYAAMIQSVDESVGRVMAKIDDLGLAENTLIFFSSDNGGVGGYAGAGIPSAKGITDNAPLRGGKGMLYEGGIRVPLIARWPSVIKPGTTCEQPVISVDFMPTFQDLANASIESKYTLDGNSIVPLLKDAQTAAWQRSSIYWHFPGYLEANANQGTWRSTPAGAIRAGDFKLIEFFETGRVELYNVKEDISEKTDLSDKNPTKTREMMQKLASWRESVKAPMAKPKS